MGQSTDAILVFGIAFEEGEWPPQKEDLEEKEDRDEEDGDEEEWLESIIVAEAGIPKPPEPYEENKEAHQAYWAASRKAKKDYPVEVITHCSGDYPMYILAINGTERNASRGYPKVIDPNSLVVPQDKIDALKAFCDKYSIPYTEPKWLLCSYWG